MIFLGSRSLSDQAARSACTLAVFLPLLLLLGAGCASTEGRRSRERDLPFPGERQPSAAETEAPDEPKPTVVGYNDYRDPLKPVNRAIFAFNDVAYRYVLIPVANGYVAVTPDPVEASVGNVFYNIKMPIYAINHLLQGKPKQSGHNLARFGINTTVGILGLFDPAANRYDMPRRETHLEATLAQYGAGYGVYLVLPILGPSDVRNGVSQVGDYLMNPVVYLTENPATAAVQSFDYLQEFAPRADRYRTLRKKADAPYIFFRNMYLQGVMRDAEY